MMTHLPYAIFYIFFAFLLTGCTQNNTYNTNQQEITNLISTLNPNSAKTISADNNLARHIDANVLFDFVGFDFMNAVDSIHFIPLQTSEDNLIGKVEKLIMTDKMIYLSDNSTIFIFKTNGDFLTKITPLDYNPEHPSPAFSYDYDNNELIVVQPNSISYFSPNGIFKRKEITPYIASDIAILDNKKIITSNNPSLNAHLGDIAQNSLFIINNNNQLEAAALPFTTSFSPPVQKQSLITYNSHTLISRAFSDTIFSYDATGLHALYILDFDSQKIHDNALLQDETHFKKALLGNNKYFFDGYAIETSNGLFFKLSTLRAQTLYAYYDVKTRKLFGGLHPVVDFNKIPPIYEPIASAGNYYVSLFRPYQLEVGQSFTFSGNNISEEEKLKIAHVTHDDNPIVVLFKICL